MSTCPACRWENDADSGTCAGCGRDLAAGAGAGPALDAEWSAPEWPAPESPAPRAPEPPAAVPEPRPHLDDVVQPVPPGTPEPPPAFHRIAEPVQIRPQARPVPQTVEPVREAPRPVDLAREPRATEAARRAPAPLRDIPVVVAPTATRAAGRFRDNEVAPDPGLPFDAPGRTPVGAGTRLCPSCGSVVEDGRRFCRCGARLPSAQADRAGAGASAAEGWSTAAFRRAQRAANGGRRVRFDAPLSARAYLVRALAVVLLVLVLGSQAPPWGADVRHWVQTRVELALPGH